MPVKVWPRPTVAGSDGPEYENCAVDTDTLVIVIERKLVLVNVTDFGALVVPTDCVPKFSEEVKENPRA